jgi:hypothetical protein
VYLAVNTVSIVARKLKKIAKIVSFRKERGNRALHWKGKYFPRSANRALHWKGFLVLSNTRAVSE